MNSLPIPLSPNHPINFYKTLRLCASVLFLVFCFVFLFSCLPVQAADTELPDFLQEEQYEEPLKFELIDVKDKSKHSVRIVWKTNHPAEGRLRYGKAPEMPNSLNRLQNVARHSVTLKNLTEGTKYGFRVYAWDNSDRRIRSQVVFFRTEGMAPPKFKKVQVKKKTLEGGTVRWETNTPTRGLFECGYDTPFQFETEHDTPAKLHQVRLHHFHPERKVYYRIRAEDTRGRTAITGLKSFRTRENNVAWGKPVEGTFDHKLPGLPRSARGGEPPYIDRVNDGSYDYNTGMATSGDPADTTQWVTIDLEQLYVPDTIVLYWRYSAYPREYYIHGSVAGVNWKEIAGPLDADEASDQTTPGGGGRTYKQVLTLSEVESEYRYLKLTVPRGAEYYAKYESYNYVQLMELKMFPKPVFEENAPAREQ